METGSAQSAAGKVLKATVLTSEDGGKTYERPISAFVPLVPSNDHAVGIR